MIETELVDEELVFAPSFGFRSSRVLETPANLVIERERQTLTVTLRSDRDGTTLHFTVLGFDAPAEMGPGPDASVRVSEPARVRDDRGREIAPHPRWQTAGIIRRRLDGSLLLDWQLKLQRLAADVRRVELSFGGPAGDWTVDIPVVSTAAVGIPAVRCAAADVHHGIAIAATAFARSSELTAIELEANDLDEREVPLGSRKRYIQGIGGHSFSRLEPLVLRDDRGNEHREQGGIHGGVPAPPNRLVLRFPALPDEARSGVIEISFVAAQERTDETPTLAVPSENDINFLGCDARISVSRIADRDGPKVRVEVAPQDPLAERQLLYFTRVEVEGGPMIGMTSQHSPGMPVVAMAPDPAASPTVRLRGPVVRLGGPWRLEIPFA